MLITPAAIEMQMPIVATVARPTSDSPPFKGARRSGGGGGRTANPDVESGASGGGKDSGGNRGSSLTGENLLITVLSTTMP